MSLKLSAPSTALVLIDLQKGILSTPKVPHSVEDILARSSQLAKAFKNAYSFLVFVHVNFAANYADSLSQAVDSPFVLPEGGLPRDWGEFAPEIATIPPDLIISKRQWGAFYGTELDLQLRRRKIDTIVLAGVATNFGVEQTAREAWQNNYNVVIVEDACTSVSAEHHAFSIKHIMPRISLVRSTEDVLASLAVS